MSSRTPEETDGEPEPICIFDPADPKLNAADALERLFPAELQDRKVVLISVAGRRRKGKSFLLNFFIRYLRAWCGNKQAIDDWMKHDAESENTGFPWKRTTKSVTQGILIWPELFEINEEITVILMDTQGVFDDESTLQTDSYLFALSLLLSSVQIFNIEGDIDRDYLKNLDLFTKIGRMVLDGASTPTENSSRKFQQLILLIRDWANAHEYNYGWSDGRDKLNDMFMKRGANGASASTWASLDDCFESIECFLMPRPGDGVVENSSRKLSDVRKIFKDNVKEFVEYFFRAENLKPKKFNGRETTIGELAEITKRCIGELRSGRYPIVGDVVSSVAINLINAVTEKCVDEYQDAMLKLVAEGPFEPTVFEDHLERNSQNVLELFRSSRKIDVDSITGKALRELILRINFLQRKFREINDKAFSEKRSFKIRMISGVVTGATVGATAGIRVGSLLGGLHGTAVAGTLGAATGAVVGAVAAIVTPLLSALFGNNSRENSDKDCSKQLLQKKML